MSTLTCRRNRETANDIVNISDLEIVSSSRQAKGMFPGVAGLMEGMERCKDGLRGNE